MGEYFNLNTVLACSSNNLPGVELQASDSVVVFDRIEYSTGAQVPNL